MTTCDDPPTPVCNGIDDGTLRKAFSCAHSGDTIDLTQLQCSKITVSAPLITDAASLTLLGPGRDKLSIDGGGQSQVFVHHGGPYDSLYINDLTIANGRFENPSNSGGGGACIYSTGNVQLNSSTVSSCYSSAAGLANGGAIYVFFEASLYRSTVSGSTAHGIGNADAEGGGISADIVALNRSTVSGNTAASALALGYGGGVAAITLYANLSTISGNAGDRAAGVFGDVVYLTDSTVSGNETPAGGRIGGVYARTKAKVFGSTIARNKGSGGIAAGLFVPLPSDATVTLQSTIIAGNQTDGAELDVGTLNGQTIPGHNNLIMVHQAGTTVPGDTLTSDPLLSLLRDNGGPTRTHALLPGSPAIDHGSNTGGLKVDQRDQPRVVGSLPDIGAYEFDPDTIFVTGFN